MHGRCFAVHALHFAASWHQESLVDERMFFVERRGGGESGWRQERKTRQVVEESTLPDSHDSDTL